MEELCVLYHPLAISSIPPPRHAMPIHYLNPIYLDLNLFLFPVLPLPKKIIKQNKREIKTKKKPLKCFLLHHGDGLSVGDAMLYRPRYTP